MISFFRLFKFFLKLLNASAASKTDIENSASREDETESLPFSKKVNEEKKVEEEFDVEESLLPAFLAAKSNDVEKLKQFNPELLKRAKCRKLGQTLLHVAVHYCRIEAVKYLLASGCNIHERAEGGSPIHSVCYMGTEELLEILVGAGADIRSQDEIGWPPLHLAVCFGRPDLIAPILRLGGEIDHRDKKGRTALMIACSTRKPHCAKVLLEMGAKIDFKDLDGATAFFHALSNGVYEIVHELIKKGQSLKEQDPSGDNILHHFGRYCDLDVAKQAIDAGCDIDALSKAGYTPLNLAFYSDRFELAQLLIDHGAKFHINSANGISNREFRDPVKPEAVTEKVMSLFERVKDTAPGGEIPATDILTYLAALSGSKYPSVVINGDEPQRHEDDSHYSSEQRLEKIRELVDKYCEAKTPHSNADKHAS